MNSRTSSMILAVAAALSLSACGGDSQPGGGDVLSSSVDGNSVAVALSDDGGKTLGAVKMPRPVWLPADFPLPSDARIYTMVAQEKQNPPIYMLQARTHSDGANIVNAFMEWAGQRGLKAERHKSPNPQSHIASVDKGNDNRVELQVHPQGDGVNNIVLAANGRP